MSSRKDSLLIWMWEGGGADSSVLWAFWCNCVRYTSCTSNSYNMATRALADLSPEGAKRPRAINQSIARGAML